MIWINEALQFFGGFLISVGGASAIIIWLSKKFGEIWAQKYLYREKNELQKDFTNYKSQLEFEIEKQKTKLFRFSNKQFDLYNILWIELSNLKIAGDELWEEASPENLMQFASSLKMTKDEVLKSKLFIEGEHYERLQNLLREFSNFRNGKENLIQFRNKDRISESVMNEIREDYLIGHNRRKRELYNSLLDDIASSFREQLA